MQTRLKLALVVILAAVQASPGSAVALQTVEQGRVPPIPPRVVHDTKHDVSPPLRTIPPKPYEAPTTIEERPEPGESRHIPPRRQVVDPVVQPDTSPIASMPSPSVNFDGVTNRNGVYPPDTNGDVGPNHYVQFINLSFQIWNKQGVSLYGPANGNTLWTGFGAPCETRNDGDPIVLYDSLADRWIMAQFTAASPYGECVAVSTSPDPTGTWYRYFFSFSTSVFYDYPHLGVWSDGYYMSANRFGTFFQGASAIVFDRAKMLNGQAASFQQFNLNTTYGTLMPSDIDGTQLPPAGAPNVFAELSSTALHLWKFHVDWATPANSTFSGPTTLPVAAFNQLCPGTRSCVPQPGTSPGLDGLGDRLMYRFAYRNFGDHESSVVAQNVNAASSGMRAGVRWYEIRNVTTSASLFQQGTFVTADGSHGWMGSVAMDKDGNIALGYSVSSSTVYPSIRYTGRLAADAAGQMTQGETTLVSGAGSQTGTASRWGDYAMMAIDPTDDCTFWFTSEYMPSTGTAPWKTRIGAFKFPTCGAGGATSTPTSTPTNTAVPATATPTPTPTNTAVPATATPTPTPTNTAVPTTATPTPTPTNTAVPATATPTPTPTQTPIPVSAPSAPQSLAAVPANGRGVNLTWLAPANNGGSPITGYRLYRSTASGTETFLTSLGLVLNYKDTGTVRGARYYYTITAVNAIGESVASNEATSLAK